MKTSIVLAVLASFFALRAVSHVTSRAVNEINFDLLR